MRDFNLSLRLGLSALMLLLLAGCSGNTKDPAATWATDFLDILARRSVRIMVNSGSLIVGSQISDTDTVSLASGGGLELALGDSGLAQRPLRQLPVESITVTSAIAATSPIQLTAAPGDPLPLTGVVLSYDLATRELTLILPSFGLASIGILNGGIPVPAPNNLKYHRVTLRIGAQIRGNQWSYTGMSQRFALGLPGQPGALENGSAVEGYLMVL